MSKQATGTLGTCLPSARVRCAICETGVAECSLDNPTPPSKPLARLHAVARDTRCAAPTAQPSPMGSRSVRSIGMQLSWTFAGTACQPLTAGIDSTNRKRKRASCPARPRSGSLEEARAHLPASGVCSRVCPDQLDFGLCARPRQVPLCCSVNAGLILYDLAVISAPSKNRFVDTLPYARQHPFVKTTPACHADAAVEFARQVLPRYTSLENKPDSARAARSSMRGRPPFGDGRWVGR